MFDLWKILDWLKKNIKLRDWILIGLIIIAFLLTRLINLEKFPIFTDEGIYIRWAKVAWHDATWRFISLTDGKQPLQTWGTIPFLKLFPENPILAGRLFSVTSGFGALFGIFVLLFYLFGKKAAYWGSFFYLFTPYFLFYDRMALVDSAVNTSAIWILFLSILLIKTSRLDIALLFGLIAGKALLAKSSSQMFIGLSALSPILVMEKNLKNFIRRFINFYFLYLIVAIMGLVIYNVQRLSPFLHYVRAKNANFVMTFSEFLNTPFLVFYDNLKLIPEYVLWESAFVLPMLGIIGFWYLAKKDWRLSFYLILWIVLPFFAIAFFAKTLFPRYLIFFCGLFTILAAYLFSDLRNKLLKYTLIAAYVISVFYFDYTILFDHKNIPFPPVDRGQYIESKNSGWGIKEIMDYSRKNSERKPVVLIAEGNFGLVGDMLEASLKKSDTGITVHGYWPLNEKDILENKKLLRTNHVFIVFSHRDIFPEHWPIRLINKYDKPGNKSAFYFYELLESK